MHWSLLQEFQQGKLDIATPKETGIFSPWAKWATLTEGATRAKGAAPHKET
jgi:hypothetical protein